MTTGRQRLITTDLGDGKPPHFRRTTMWPDQNFGSAVALISYAQADGTRASMDDPGVVTTVRPDGYYYVTEQRIGTAGPLVGRVIAVGHLDPRRWSDAQLHHIHARQCPAEVRREVGETEHLSHCGVRIDLDDNAEAGPFCEQHQDNHLIGGRA